MPNVNIAGALSGFGAGLQGRGLEFMQQQRADKQFQGDQAEAERQHLIERSQAAYTDAVAALRMADAGDYGSIVDLTENRAQLLGGFEGADNSDTLRIQELAMASAQGDTEAQRLIKAELQSHVSVGAGLFPDLIQVPSAVSPLGKTQQDVDAGLLTQAQMDESLVSDSANIQFGAGVQVQDSEGNLFSSITRKNPNTGQVEQVLTSLGGSDVTPVGSIQMVGTTGLTPEQAIEQRGLEAGTSAAATAAISASKDAFDQLQGIDNEIAVLDDVVRLLDDENVDTGPVLARMPTFRSNAIELDNLQSRLGLNVIQNTTFGSLSQEELAFALRTALPTNLPPAELKDWIVRKQAAQRKLSNHIKEAAIFLGTPGNSIPKWLDYQKTRQVLVEASGAQNPASQNLIFNPETGQLE